MYSKIGTNIIGTSAATRRYFKLFANVKMINYIEISM